MNCLCSLFIVSMSVLLCNGAEKIGPCAKELKDIGDKPWAKPQCTEKGYYELIQTHNNYSRCANPLNGETIVSVDKPPCPACVTKLARLLKTSENPPKCYGNTGNFKPTQTDGQVYWCVDTQTGQRIGEPQRDNSTLYCYQMQLADGYTGVMEEEFNKGPCAKERKATADVPSQIDSEKPACTEKGYYELIQMKWLEGITWCVNPSTGKTIKGTEEKGKLVSDKTCPKCVTNLAKALKTNVLVGGYPPQCDSAGNYKTIQTNGDLFWCIDTRNGQILGETQGNASTLKCGQ